MQLVDQAVGDGLLAHQVRGIRLDRLDAADAHDGGRQQQHDDQAEAGEQHPEDVLVGDLPRKHRVISIARSSGRSYPQARAKREA